MVVVVADVVVAITVAVVVVVVLIIHVFGVCLKFSEVNESC